MKKNILQALHASGIGAHSGITATYHLIKALFAWTGIFQSVESFVNKCQKGRGKRDRAGRIRSRRGCILLPSEKIVATGVLNFVAMINRRVG